MQHAFPDVTCDCLFVLLVHQDTMVFTQAAYERKNWDACARLVPAIKVALHSTSAAAAAELLNAVMLVM